MPYAAKRPCSHPGCPQFQPCPKHTAQRQQQARDRQRGSAASRGYDSAWSRFSAIYKSQHPFCVECLRQGIVTATKQTDHVIPLRFQPERKFDEANLQGLCDKHHNAKTLGEQRSPGTVWHEHLCSQCSCTFAHADAFCEPKQRARALVCNVCVEDGERPPGAG